MARRDQSARELYLATETADQYEARQAALKIRLSELAERRADDIGRLIAIQSEAMRKNRGDVSSIESGLDRKGRSLIHTLGRLRQIERSEKRGPMGVLRTLAQKE
jgi:hypothetical protein